MVVEELIEAAVEAMETARKGKKGKERKRENPKGETKT